MGTIGLKKLVQLGLLAVFIVFSFNILAFGILVAFFCLYTPHLVEPKFLSGLLFGLPKATALPVAAMIIGLVLIGYSKKKVTKRGGVA